MRSAVLMRFALCGGLFVLELGLLAVFDFARELAEAWRSARSRLCAARPRWVDWAVGRCGGVGLALVNDGLAVAGVGEVGAGRAEAVR
ncbi:hypothetical protein GCM10018965_067940 [Nonomuraea roseola]